MNQTKDESLETITIHPGHSAACNGIWVINRSPNPVKIERRKACKLFSNSHSDCYRDMVIGPKNPLSET